MFDIVKSTINKEKSMVIENLTFFILAQVCSLIAIILALISLFAKKQLKLFTFQILSNIFYCLNFILLEAYVGSILMLLAIIRNSVSLIFTLRKKEIELSEIVIFETIFLIAGVISFANIYDIFTIMAHLIFTFGILQKNRAIFLTCQAVASVSSIVYNIFHASYVGIGLEALALITAIIALTLLFKQAKTTNAKFNFQN